MEKRDFVQRGWILTLGLSLVFGLLYAQAAAASPTEAFIIQPVSVPPAMINASGCWPGIYISLLNSQNQPGTIPSGNSVTISFSGTATTRYYSDSNCTQAISSITLTGSATPVAQQTIYAKDSVTEVASVSVSGIDTSQYNVHNCSAVPQPATPVPAQNGGMFPEELLVTGSSNSNDENDSQPESYATGENFTSEVLGTPTFSSCAQVAPSTAFSGETIPSDKLALLTLYGTPSYDSSGNPYSTSGSGPTAGTLANATIKVMQYVSNGTSRSCSSGMTAACSTSSGDCYCTSYVAVTPSSSPPSGIPTAFTPATKPSGYSTLEYVALPAVPQDLMPGHYASFYISSSATGDIGYTIQSDVVGSASGSEKQFSTTGGTNFAPLLAFTGAKQYITSGQCSSSSGESVSLTTEDGNGNQTNVLPGKSLVTRSSNALSISLTSTPAELFVDSACYFPAIGMTISNPPVSQPAGTPSGTIAYGSNHINFYYKSNVAENFDLGASYVVSELNESAIPMDEQVNAPDPTTIEVAMPSAVNQSVSGQLNCSSGIVISLQDAYGNLSGAQVCPKSIALSGDSTARFYSDPSCSDPLPGNILSIPVGASSATVYVSDSQPENLSIEASDNTNYSSASCQNGSNGETSGSEMTGASGSIPVLTLGQVAPPTASLVANITRNLYLRLVGLPPNQSDLSNPQTVYAKMYQDVQSGQMLAAAELATSQDGFYNVTIRNLATSLSNQLFNPLYPLNDFVTTWIGVARDGIDARQLLTGNYIYAPNSYGSCSGTSCGNLTGKCASPQSVIYDENGKSYSLGGSVDLYSNGAAYQAMDNNFINLRKNLVQVPQCAYNSFNANASASLLMNSHLQSASGQQAPASAGLLTTRAWGIAHLYQGTNRRAIREAMNVFLCRDITQLSDTTMADGHVRRDVDRAPGGNASTYTNTCVGCHAGMDSMGGAYAFFDAYWPNGVNPEQNVSVASATLRVVYSDTSMQTYADNEDDPENCNGTSSTMPKMKRNCIVYPSGYIPGDDSWVNEFISNQNASLDWDPNLPLNGNGINALGNMLANSGAFNSCMATRAFTELCKRAPSSSQDDADVQSVANDFATSHSFSRLFALTATLPECLSNSGGN